MASRVHYRHRAKPWRARQRRNGVEYFLGYFETKEQAEEEERKFNEQWPRNWGWSKGLKRYGKTYC